MGLSYPSPDSPRSQENTDRKNVWARGAALDVPPGAQRGARDPDSNSLQPHPFSATVETNNDHDRYQSLLGSWLVSLAVVVIDLVVVLLLLLRHFHPSRVVPA